MTAVENGDTETAQRMEWNSSVDICKPLDDVRVARDMPCDIGANAAENRPDALNFL